jgi:predicted Holliday junction resolvase-like endonuclease
VPPQQQTIMVIAGLAGLCALLFWAWLAALRRIAALRDDLEDERSRQKSLSTTYGRITEQWFPLMDAYPYDAQGFRFLGSPVDGVQFEDDRIVFVEFKANRSDLSRSQRRLKRLVQEGHVYWEEFRFTDDGAAERAANDEKDSDDDGLDH